MLRSFRNKDIEKIWEGKVSRKYPVEIQQRVLRKLFMMDKAQTLEDLRIPPENRLESLTGERTGQYSIRVNDQWRICFSWEDGKAENVGLVDYH